MKRTQVFDKIQWIGALQEEGWSVEWVGPYRGGNPRRGPTTQGPTLDHLLEIYHVKKENSETVVSPWEIYSVLLGFSI